MNTFHVWLRPLGESCRVRVEGVENARWLIARLSQSRDLKISATFGAIEDTSDCSFEVPCNAALPRTRFERFLAAIPEVILMTQPECEMAAGQVRV
jgi:hypothetical protein